MCSLRLYCLLEQPQTSAHHPSRSLVLAHKILNRCSFTASHLHPHSQAGGCLQLPQKALDRHSNQRHSSGVRLESTVQSSKAPEWRWLGSGVGWGRGQQLLPSRPLAHSLMPRVLPQRLLGGANTWRLLSQRGVGLVITEQSLGEPQRATGRGPHWGGGPQIPPAGPPLPLPCFVASDKSLSFPGPQWTLLEKSSGSLPLPASPPLVHSTPASLAAL